MMEGDAIQIGFEAEVAAQRWKKIGGKNRLLNIGEKFCLSSSTRKTV